MDKNDLEALLELSIQAAQTPGLGIVRWFEAGRLSVEQKRDGSPVTIADREAETAIREILSLSLTHI